MLTELAVTDLGIIPRLRVVLGPGMTALTGETGAGKTLLVQAIELLVGGRADPMLVRSGADEAFVEGRFEVDGEETVLARAVPRAGRSRGYINGRMAPRAELAEVGAALVDLHGQHAHQSLLGASVQRAALDQLAGVDLGPVRAARAAVAALDAELQALGGDERSRARETELLAFQLAELAAARVSGPDEDEVLSADEDRLADATAHREAAAAAHQALAGDGGGAEALSGALAALAGRAPLAGPAQRLRALAVDLDDVASELRAATEELEDDPARLAEVRARRALLRELCRKYGPTLAEVIEYQATAQQRSDALQTYEQRATALGFRRDQAVGALQAAEAAVGALRRAAAPGMGRAVEEHLGTLALAGARFEVAVEGPGVGDDVRFLLAANPGEDLLPLARVASGGELARAMLALRLVVQQAARGLDGGPATLVFDEVDAGIGGEAALAVGRALAALAGPSRQVLVVTHLPQVAAFADHQVAVSKDEHDARPVATARAVDGEPRVVELSRMLSGRAGSTAARDHAEELLAVASRDRAGGGPG